MTGAGSKWEIVNGARSIVAKSLIEKISVSDAYSDFTKTSTFFKNDIPN